MLNKRLCYSWQSGVITAYSQNVAGEHEHCRVHSVPAVMTPHRAELRGVGVRGDAWPVLLSCVTL